MLPDRGQKQGVWMDTPSYQEGEQVLGVDGGFIGARCIRGGAVAGRPRGWRNRSERIISRLIGVCSVVGSQR